jgi:hypothetical protein
MADGEKKRAKMSKKTIVFDFDGVIHKGYNGWKDGAIYGEIDVDLLKYIRDMLLDKYYVAICSNRPAEQIVSFMNENFGEFLKFELKDDKDLFWSKDNVIGVSNKKIAGIIYIDDRGYRYKGLEDLFINIAKYLE